MSTGPVPAGGAGLDQRVPGPAMVLRFVLFLILLLISVVSLTAGTMSDLVSVPVPGIHEPSNFSVNSSVGCELAAGVDPEGGAVGSYLPTALNWTAFQACEAHYRTGWNSPWWVGFAAIGILIAAAGALYWGLPVWKGRRRRVTDVAEIGGGVRQLLSELSDVVGLSRQPRFVVDPVAATTSAVVFGRPRRYTVCLHGGLVSRRAADPAGFRAVILHELAHIKNRDVGITYATVAIWRTYLVMVLLPYAVTSAWALFNTQILGWDANSIWWPGARSMYVHDFLFSAFVVLLVYLGRADILRSREIYADLAAVHWGADPVGWHHGMAGTRGSARISGVLSSLAEFWRTHPAWDLRKYSLADPAVLYGVPALQLFLTGAASTIIIGQLSAGHGEIGWLRLAQISSVVGLAAAISGVLLWRAVTYAVLTNRPVPSGIRAGLWLGAGLAAGELLLFGTGGANLLPSRPVFLLPLGLIAIAACWWTVEYAELSIRTSGGRSTRMVMLAGLVATWLALVVGVSWWQLNGQLFASGWPLPPPGALQLLDPATRPLVPGHSGMLQVFAAAIMVWPLLPSNDLVVAPSLALFLLPFAIWARRPGTLLRLRRIVLPAVLGGILCWAATAVVMAYMHSWHTPHSQRFGSFYLTYETWLVIGVTGGTVAAAAAASIAAPRYRLISALSAACLAALVGVAGAFVLVASDGCLRPLTTLAGRCGWQPRGAWLVITWLPPYVLGLAMVTATTPAILVAAVCALARWMTRKRVRQAPIWRPRPHKPGVVRAERACVALIGAVAIWLTFTTSNSGLFAPTGSAQARQRGTSTTSVAQLVAGSAAARPSPIVQELQLYAWYFNGGTQLLSRLEADAGTVDSRLGNLVTALKKAPTARTFHQASTPMVPVCTDLKRMPQAAGAFFPVPDQQIQATWSTMITLATKSGTDCLTAVRQADETPLITSLHELASANITADLVLQQLRAKITKFCRALHQRC